MPPGPLDIYMYTSLLLLSMLLCYYRVLHIPPLDYASWTFRFIYLSMLLCYCRVLHIPPLDYASWTFRYIYLCYNCLCYCVIVELYIFHPWTMPPGPCQPLLHPSRYGFHHLPVERNWRPDREPRLREAV